MPHAACRALGSIVPVSQLTAPAIALQTELVESVSVPRIPYFVSFSLSLSLSLSLTFWYVCSFSSRNVYMCVCSRWISEVSQIPSRNVKRKKFDVES
jgi:hypothetical protein